MPCLYKIIGLSVCLTRGIAYVGGAIGEWAGSKWVRAADGRRWWQARAGSITRFNIL